MADIPEFNEHRIYPLTTLGIAMPDDKMPEVRSYIKVACIYCHDKRVKCDRSDGIPCTKCRIAGRHCEPIISRRGRYAYTLPLRIIQNTNMN
jgi:hypothetical protein